MAGMENVKATIGGDEPQAFAPQVVAPRQEV
jgi:hypothetical protein